MFISDYLPKFAVNQNFMFMKKLLLSTMMVAAGLFAANAAEVTISFPAVLGPGTSDGKYPSGENNIVVTTCEDQGFSFAFDKGAGSSDPKYYSYMNNGNDEGSLRLYSNNVMTITAPDGATMTNIDFTLPTNSWNHADSDSEYAFSTGTFTAGFTADNQPATANWAGSADVLTLNMPSQKNSADEWPQLRIMTMTITYEQGEVTQCSNPRFSLAEGTYYEAQEVAISCTTAGATIMYKINGGAEQAYSEPISLSEVGTYTIEAYAKKDGLDNSATVEATYTIANRPVITFQKMDPNNVVEGRYVIAYTEDVTTYIMKNEVYQNFYVKGEEYDLTAGAPSEEYIFTVAKSGNGYTIQNNDGTYVALVKNGTHTNLKPAEATPYVWTFSGTADAVVATGDGMGNSYLQFQLYSGRTPEFCADSRYESPVFYLVDDNTPENQCKAPVFSLAGGTYWSAQNVELTTATEGAEIVYTINGGAETVYNAPIELTVAEEPYVIEAYARKSGMDNSVTVSATYTISAPVACENIDEYIALAEVEGEGAMFEWTFPVTVTGVMPSYTYVRDDEGGAMLIYGREVPAYEVGDVIPAGIIGGFSNHYGLYEMQNVVVESFGESTATGNGNPVVMTAGAITDGDMNKVVYLDNVTYVETKSGESITRTAEDATGSIRLWMQKNWDVQTPENGTVVDLICAVAVNNDDLQVYPMEFLDASNTPDFSGVAGVVAGNTVVTANADGVVVVAAEAVNVSVYNAAGQLVASENVAAGENVINVPAGFYIVKAGDTVAKVIVK